MAQANLNRRLSAQDAAFLYNEREEEPMNIGSVAVFQGEIPYQRLRDNIESKLHLIPRYRQKITPAPLNLNHPTWDYDPNFDIRNHVRLVQIDPPGTDDQLRDLAARLFQGMLSRDKPLWEINLVHGLEGGRSALVSRVHHCLVDGVSGIELLMIVLDVSPNPPPPPPAPPAEEPEEAPDPVMRLFDALFDRMADNLKTIADFQKGLLDTIDQPDPLRSLTRALETALPYFTVPVRRAPFNKRLTPERKLAWSAYEFSEFRAIRQVTGGTVNDVVLAILGGALDRYYEAHGTPTDGQTARILTPVNVRRENERGALGNRISMLLVEVPLGLRDPIERLTIIRDQTERLKRQNIADGLEVASNGLAGISPWVQAMAGALPKPPNTVANMVCTNVPGPMIPLYCVGHQLEAHYPLFPIAWEMGVGCAVTSYNQKLYFGLMADASAAPDVDRLATFLTDAYAELRGAAGVPMSELPQIGVESRGKPRARPAPAAGQSLAADAG